MVAGTITPRSRSNIVRYLTLKDRRKFENEAIDSERDTLVPQMTLARSSDSSWALGNEFRSRFEPAGVDDGNNIGADEGIAWRRDGVAEDRISPLRERLGVSTIGDTGKNSGSWLPAGCLAGVPNPRRVAVAAANESPEEGGFRR